MMCFCYFCDLYHELAFTEPFCIQYMMYFIVYFSQQIIISLREISVSFVVAVHLKGLAQYKVDSRSSENIYLIYLHMYLFTYLPIDFKNHVDISHFMQALAST